MYLIRTETTIFKGPANSTIKRYSYHYILKSLLNFRCTVQATVKRQVSHLVTETLKVTKQVPHLNTCTFTVTGAFTQKGLSLFLKFMVQKLTIRVRT